MWLDFTCVTLDMEETHTLLGSRSFHLIVALCHKISSWMDRQHPRIHCNFMQSCIRIAAMLITPLTRILRKSDLMIARLLSGASRITFEEHGCIMRECVVIASHACTCSPTMRTPVKLAISNVFLTYKKIRRTNGPYTYAFIPYPNRAPLQPGLHLLGRHLPKTYRL